MEESVLHWCKRLVECRSVSGEGTREIIELCARELLAPRGIEARVLPSATEGPAQANLIARIKGHDSSAAPLVLNTHLDTVPPGELALWTECHGNPFAPMIKDSRIYGLGAADTKLDFIAKVFALSAVPQPRRDVCLMATFGEEHGMVGARELADAQILPRGALAYIGEASHLQVITAHKGFMVFDLALRFDPRRMAQPCIVERIAFNGRAAHSSTPALGVNAIRLALIRVRDKPAMQVVAIKGGDAVNKVPSHCELSVIADGFRDSPSPQSSRDGDSALAVIPRAALMALLDFIDGLQEFADSAGTPELDYAPPTLTCNPGVLNSGDGEIKLEFELRPPPAMSLDEVREGVERTFARLEHERVGIGVELTEHRANPGFRSMLDSATVELATNALAAAGLPVELGVKAGCTEAGIYAAAGLYPVVFGPGIATGVIHAPNEYNLLSDVDGAIRFYSQLLTL